ncbi:FtsX-like permease family protein [Agathobacter sp.]
MNKVYRKLAFTNIKNNGSLYLPYIISGMITVAMFYIMMFLNNSKGLEKIYGASYLTEIMALGVGVIAIFSYIFIFYTNSFIIKRRKKEIGVYNILGMEKRHIAKVMGIETITVALIAIVGGIMTGILFSKLSIMLLYKILAVKETVKFEINFSTITNTLIVFGILYALTLVYNMMQIKLANPIELLRGGNVGEKEPKSKWLMAIVGVGCLAVAYYISITTENPLKVLTLFFLAVLLVIIGTYLLFIAGSIVFLKMLRKNKKFYYNKKHFAAVSGMIYRMKQNAGGLASICILSTMVLVIIATTVSLYIGLDDELKTRYPMEAIAYVNYTEVNEDVGTVRDHIKQIIEDEGRTITREKTYGYFNIFTKQQDDKIEKSTQYESNGSGTYLNIVTKDALCNLEDSFDEKDIPKLTDDSVAVYGMKKYNYDSINILGREFDVKESKYYKIKKDAYLSSSFTNEYYIVVNNMDTLTQLFNLQKEVYGDQAFSFSNTIGFDFDGTKQQKIDCTKKINKYLESDVRNQVGDKGMAYVEGRAENEEAVYTLYGGLFFLGIFLGAMFLMVTVMIIFYKQTSEGYDDKDRYEIMEKVGMSNAEVKKSIQSQVRMVFFLPIVTAAIHVTAAFPMLRRLLVMFNLTDTQLIIECMIGTLLVFLAIYYLVFKLTSRAYYKIVGNQV